MSRRYDPALWGYEHNPKSTRKDPPYRPEELTGKTPPTGAVVSIRRTVFGTDAMSLAPEPERGVVVWRNPERAMFLVEFDNGGRECYRLPLYPGTLEYVTIVRRQDR